MKVIIHMKKIEYTQKNIKSMNIDLIEDVTFVSEFIPWYKRWWNKIKDIYNYIKQFFNFCNKYFN